MGHPPCCQRKHGRSSKSSPARAWAYAFRLHDGCLWWCWSGSRVWCSAYPWLPEHSSAAARVAIEQKRLNSHNPVNVSQLHPNCEPMQLLSIWRVVIHEWFCPGAWVYSSRMNLT